MQGTDSSKRMRNNLTPLFYVKKKFIEYYAVFLDYPMVLVMISMFMSNLHLEFFFFLDLTKVELKSQNSNFWRRQEGIPRSYLSTIEAIYYFMRDVHIIFLETEYANEYDNILFFFCFMYNKIQSSKNNSKKKKK